MAPFLKILAKLKQNSEIKPPVVIQKKNRGTLASRSRVEHHIYALICALLDYWIFSCEKNPQLI